MKRLLPLLFCLCSVCHAQTKLAVSYIYVDSCPDPQKNHIAQRTIYISRHCDNFGTCYFDTVVENYDRKGRLIRREDRAVDEYWMAYNHSIHHYSYDKKNRITRDTGIYTMKDIMEIGGIPVETRHPQQTSEFLIEYSYPNSNTVVVHMNAFGFKSSRTEQYDKNHSLISLLDTRETGDTIRRVYTHGDTIFSVTYWNHFEGEFWDPDSTVTHRAKNHTYHFTSRYNDNYWGSPVTTLTYYDKQGRPEKQLKYHHNNFPIDSIYYAYDQQGNLIDETTYYFATRTTYSEIHRKHYSYVNGLLTEYSFWREKDPDQVIHYVRYTYNDKGLRTKAVYSERYGNNAEQILRTEVWEYAYW